MPSLPCHLLFIFFYCFVMLGKIHRFKHFNFPRQVFPLALHEGPSGIAGHRQLEARLLTRQSRGQPCQPPLYPARPGAASLLHFIRVLLTAD